MTETKQETTLEVVDRQTGEVIDVRDAETPRLAAFVEAIADFRAELKDGEDVVLGELLRRLDRRGEWTHRVGDVEDGVQFEITAASPTAGTIAYDVPTLREKLLALLEADEIDEEAAGAALERKVTLEFQVETAQDLDELVGKLKGVEKVAGVAVRNVAVEAREKAVAGGIKRLEKIGGAAKKAAAACKRKGPRPTRRAKVKAIRPEKR